MTAAMQSGSDRDAVRADYVLQLADTCLILGQRLGEWIGHSPALEEDLGLANTALDLIGQSRLLLSYVAEIEGGGMDEDKLAFLRDQHEYRNCTLVEQPNGDFGNTIVRQVLIDAYHLTLYTQLQESSDSRLAGIAATALKEARFHLRYSGGWLVRLGDGTADSHERVQQALDRLWPFTGEFFDVLPGEEALIDRGIAPDPAGMKAGWQQLVAPLLEQATLKKPADSRYRWSGRRGVHSEHLGYILAEMQYLQRAYPGATW